MNYLCGKIRKAMKMCRCNMPTAFYGRLRAGNSPFLRRRRGVCRRSFGAGKYRFFIKKDKKTAIQERTFKKMTTFAPYTRPVCRHIEESVFASFP